MLVVREFPRVSQSFIYNKACGLARAGMDVDVVAIRQGDWAPYDFRRAEMPSSLSVSYLECPRGRWAGGVGRRGVGGALSVAWGRAKALRHAMVGRRRIRSPGDFLRASRLLRMVRTPPDLIHFEHTGHLEPLMPMIDFFGVPVVVSCRSHIDHTKMNALRLQALEELLSRADAIHCVSEATAVPLKRYRVDPAKTVINRPAVDTAFFSMSERGPSVREPVRVVTVSRLVWKKGLSDGLRAIRGLLKLGHDVEYRIVGDGVGRDSVAFEIEDMGLGDRVRLVGHVSQEGVKEVLTWADMYLHPSLTEGLSNAVIEAMSMGLPTVSTDAGGMAELVRDGENGFLVERRDVAAMVGRLARLIMEPGLRRALGLAARRTVVESFDLGRQVRDFADLYARLVGGSGIGSRDGWMTGNGLRHPSPAA